MDGMTMALFSGVLGALALLAAAAMALRKSLGRTADVHQEKPDLPGSPARRRRGQTSDTEGSDMARIEGHDLPDCYIPGPHSPILSAMAAVVRRTRGRAAAPDADAATPAPAHAQRPAMDAPDMVAQRATRPRGFGPRKPPQGGAGAGAPPRADPARAPAPTEALDAYDPDSEVLVIVWDDSIAETPPALRVDAAADAPGWHEIRADGILLGCVPHAGLTPADIRLVPQSRLPQ